MTERDEAVESGEELEERDALESIQHEDAPAPQDDEKSAPADRAERGPFDLAEVPAIRPYVDLGSLKVLPREGLQLRLDVEEGSKRIVALSLDLNNSTLQVQAFSAPKNSGVWLSIIQQIETQLGSQGVNIVRVDGAFGPEITTQSTGTQSQPMRFIGVDGPRWVLRGIVSGAAIRDEAAAHEIDELFRSLVVVRGEIPMPPRELLPLRVPAGV